MDKETDKKPIKRSGLRVGLQRMTQETADRLNRGGVQMQASYRSRINTANSEDNSPEQLKGNKEIK